MSGLVRHLFADDKSLTTLPVTAYVLGTLISTIPASMFMRIVGRRTGFQIGTLFGHTSAALSVVAIFALDFRLLCLAIFLFGGCQAFAQYCRFAAADTASPEFRPKAISWVMSGGLVSAVAGPQLVIYTKEAFNPVMYAGSFVASAFASMLAFIALSFVNIPKAPTTGSTGAPPRRLSEILKLKRLQVAIFTGMVSYASMSFVMTATPSAWSRAATH